MKYLLDLGFSQNEVEEVMDITPDIIIEDLVSNEPLVCENIKFLKELGIDNYRCIFIKFAEMFLNDTSIFRDIFSKYDIEDLITKLNKNINIVEYL